VSAKTRIALGKPGAWMKSRVSVGSSLKLPCNGTVGFIEWLALTLSRQQLHDDHGSRDRHTYARAREPAALANNIDHIIKSPPLMSRDAPVM